MVLRTGRCASGVSLDRHQRLPCSPAQITDRYLVGWKLLQVPETPAIVKEPTHLSSCHSCMRRGSVSLVGVQKLRGLHRGARCACSTFLASDAFVAECESGHPHRAARSVEVKSGQCMVTHPSYAPLTHAVCLSLTAIALLQGSVTTTSPCATARLIRSTGTDPPRRGHPLVPNQYNKDGRCSCASLRRYGPIIYVCYHQSYNIDTYLIIE